MTGWIFHSIQSHNLLTLNWIVHPLQYISFALLKICDLINIEVSFLFKWKRKQIDDEIRKFSRKYGLYKCCFYWKGTSLLISNNSSCLYIHFNKNKSTFKSTLNVHCNILVAPVLQFNAIHWGIFKQHFQANKHWNVWWVLFS